ncbi:MAG: tol-pal system protein YbgF [Myxococcales bacterium]|nr:tol-pal system protein YbgF [Myxococcales bacterium]
MNHLSSPPPRTPRIAWMAVAVALCGALLGGCGGGQMQQLDSRLEEMQADLRALRDAHEAQQQRAEALADRLALVEDRLEGQALHHPAPVPTGLPVVRLRPEQPSAAAMPREVDAEPAEPVDTREPSTITQADLDALGRGGFEPSPRPGRRRGPVAPPANAAGAGNIGVMPLAAQPSFDAAAPPGVGGPEGDDPIGAFKAAQGRFRAGDLTAAVRGFERFVETWPSHGYADNALFWLGRCRYDRAEYPAALATFRKVLERYPTGNQVPDALLMIGLTLDKLGRPSEGRETLARLRAMYPETAAARQAGAELDRSTGRM